MASNPAAAVRRPRDTIQAAPHLTPAQVASLLQAARGTQYAPLFALLVHTGLRRGDTPALQWSDVDLDRHTLRIRGTLSQFDGALVVTEPKTAKSKRLCLSAHPRAAAPRRTNRPGDRAAVGQHRL